MDIGAIQKRQNAIKSAKKLHQKRHLNYFKTNQKRHNISTEINQIRQIEYTVK